MGWRNSRRHNVGPIQDYHDLLYRLLVSLPMRLMFVVYFLITVTSFSRIGHIILVASASPASLQNSDAALGLLALSIVIIVRSVLSS